MDIVFVIDDSGSMDLEQANLAANFPLFADVIHNYVNSEGEELDYRIAVTTTGVTTTGSVDPPPQQTPLGTIDLPPTTLSQSGEDGRFQPMGGMPRPWIERSDGSVDAISTTFAQTAEVGTSGPGIEMPLRAAEHALSDRVNDGTNAGFLRPDALLATIYLTDEDDCSQRGDGWTIEGDSNCSGANASNMPLSEHITFMDTTAGARGRWATAVIAGETDCTSDFGSAAEARRLKDLVDQVGDNAVFSSICEGDLTGALTDALDTFESACESFPPVE
jgi:hypothetical protein